MPILDIFAGDAFKSVTMADAIVDSGYVPNYLRTLNIFNAPIGITTEGIAIERRQTGLELVPVTPRGAPIPQQTDGVRDLQTFKTTRIAQGDRLLASELDFVRRFGEEQATEMAQTEIARRLGTGRGDEGILNNLGLTQEYMTLELVKTGQFKDINGNILVDWGNEMRSQDDIKNNVPFAIPTITFDFATLDNGELREKLNKIGRNIRRKSRGKFMHDTEISVLVGDDFFDALGKNKEIRNHQSRQADVSFVTGNDPWGTIRYAGFAFINYRGTDDQSTVDIGLEDGHAFPTNTRGMFKHYVSHGETFADLGTTGREWYVDIVPDLERDRYVDMDVSTYPLLSCACPEVLRKFELA